VGQQREGFRVVAVVVSLACLSVAAYLAFDWADYGIDSTCGNLVTNRKAHSAPCTDIMRNRTIAVVGLAVAAAVLLGAAWATRRPRPDAS
jgi:hypothetical protein